MKPHDERTAALLHNWVARVQDAKFEARLLRVYSRPTIRTYLGDRLSVFKLFCGRVFHHIF